MQLLERQDEVTALLERQRRALGGRGGMVLVTGEPGAGKTALMQEFTDGLRGEVPILWGACDPLSTPRPLGPLLDVADQLDDAGREALRGAAYPHEIFAAVFEHLKANPSLLVVDDLHWADQGTIDLLRFLLRRIASTRSLVVGALRDEELDIAHPLRSLLGDVARSPDATTMQLRPLSVDAIAAMVEDRPADPARIAQLTGGNPFFVTEMLDHAGDDLPVSVRDAVLSRTTHLDAEAWDLLHLLTCSPEAIPDHLLPALGIGFPPLRALDQAGLLRRGPRGVAFRHDLCRLAIADAIPPGGDAPLHLRMLDALDTSPAADPAVMTHHAVGTGDRSRIVRHAAEAGRAAARSGAHTQAATFLRTALDSGAPLTPEEEADLLGALAQECYLIDRLDDAIAASGRALMLRGRIGDSTGLSSIHQSLSVYHWYNSDRGAAEEHAGRAVAVLETGDDPPAPAQLGSLGHALATQAYLAMQDSDLGEAQALVSQSTELAAGADDPTLLVRTRLIDAICSLMSGRDEGRDGDALDPEHGHGAVRRDLLERLEQPHLPRRGAAAPRPGPRDVRHQPPAHRRAGPPDLPGLAARLARAARARGGRLGRRAGGCGRRAGRPERTSRPHLAAPRARARRVAARWRCRCRLRRGLAARAAVRRVDARAPRPVGSGRARVAARRRRRPHRRRTGAACRHEGGARLGPR